jgi:hypothetical protein
MQICNQRFANFVALAFQSTTLGAAPLPRRLRQRWETLAIHAAVASLALVFSSAASAQTLPAEAYGPYNVTFLADGPGLDKQLARRDTLLDANSSWTFAFWFKSTEGTSAAPMLLAGLGDPASKDSAFIALEQGRLELLLNAGKSVQSDKLKPSLWHFAAAVADGKSVTLYLDGQPAATAPQPVGTIANSLRMAPQTAGQPHFGGLLNSLRIYREALASDQIAEMAAARPDFLLPTYEEATKRWSVQTRGMAGQVEVQDPSTLPRAKALPQKPVAKALSPADRTNQLVGPNPYKLQGGWQLAAAPDVQASGQQLSQVGFAASKWLTATVPGTVLTTLIDRGVYPDSDYGLNNMAIPESLAHQDYWYRVEFKSPAIQSGQQLTLTFQGINYAAEFWLNGHRLGTLTGAFLRGNFDVTSLVAPSGLNALAVRVSPPPHPGIANEESLKGGPGDNGGIQVIDGPTFSATEGWDWIPGIRDRNTGIWQDVTLAVSGSVQVGDLNVITTLPKSDRSQADIEIEAPLANSASQPIEGDLTASFDDVTVVKHLVLAPGQTIVRLQPADYPQLQVQNPRLWWPNGYGQPTLHALTVCFTVNGQLSSQRQIDFGMREVSYETSLFDATGHLRRVEVLPARTHDAALPLIDESHQGIRQITDQTPNILPAGQSPSPWDRNKWVHSLQPEAENSPSIVPVTTPWLGTDLVLKVNGVRIAARGGNWGMDDSRKRVSIEHLEPYFRLHRDAHVNIIRDWMGQNTEENFYALADKYGLMVWNDFWESTQGYNLEAQDPQLFLQNAQDSILHFRHHPSIVVWCGRNEGVPQPIINEGLANLVRTLDHTRYYTGSSNQVNLRNSGPYQIQPLETYYRINRGFSVELGIPSVPTLEAIKSFIPAEDRWPISDTWAYHDWHSIGNGATQPFMQHMEKQFGPPTSLEDFERKAQMLDYAAHRAIFEGFAAHLWQPNSARLIWMTQPAWPSMEWNFLGSDYDTQSSFYGTQKACEPIHAQLDLTDGSVDLINLGAEASFKVRTRVLSLDAKPLLDQTNQILASANDRTPVGKPDLAKLADGHTVLVELQVADVQGTAISDNLYWWAADEATLRELNTLPQSKLTATAKLASTGSERQATVQVKNTGPAPALLLKLTLKDAATGDRILPAYYSQNYFSLLPGEEQTITINFRAGTNKPTLTLRGWNQTETTIAVQ